MGERSGAQSRARPSVYLSHVGEEDALEGGLQRAHGIEGVARVLEQAGVGETGHRIERLLLHIAGRMDALLQVLCAPQRQPARQSEVHSQCASEGYHGLVLMTRHAL